MRRPLSWVFGGKSVYERVEREGIDLAVLRANGRKAPDSPPRPATIAGLKALPRSPARIRIAPATADLIRRGRRQLEARFDSDLMDGDVLTGFVEERFEEWVRAKLDQGVRP